MNLSHHRIAILIALAALFVLLGSYGGAENVFDVKIVQALTDWSQSSRDLTIGIIVLTWVGSAYVTLGVVALTALWLWFKRRTRLALLLAGTVFGERLIADGMKLLYDRARPVFDLHPVVTSSSSFPSGHAANSMTAFVALALLAVPERHRKLTLSIAIPLAITLGLSRPYLGVHWPTDVLGGWALAGIVLLAMDSLRRDEPQHHIVGGHRATRIEG